MSTQEIIALEEVCQRLGLRPSAVRQLLATFPEIGTVQEEGDRRGLTPDAFERLQRAAILRGQGWNVEAVREILQGPKEGAKEAAAARLLEDPADVEGLRQEIQELKDLLQKMEERRRHDQDRLLLSLIRLQQEVQHLRYELAATRSRKERRQGMGLFGRRKEP
ncbi:MAG: MerR family transcriptional regulator [Clostridiales bacterium]|nr:MerR family transcriptional regulator [Clostridiales bacterium]